MISINYLEKSTVEKAYKAVVDSKIGSLYAEINKTMQDELELEIKIEDLITASVNELYTVRDAIDKSLFFEGKSKEHKTIWKSLYKSYDLVRDSTIDHKKTNVYLINELNIRVCPYCNKNYIESRGANHAGGQLDHHINRADYPIFSVCLYNLVPACYACNHIKGTKNVSLSPLNPNVIFNTAFHFSYLLKDIDFLQNPGSLSVEFRLLEDGNTSLKDNIEGLKIAEAYETENLYVLNEIKKALCYNDVEIAYLLQNYPHLFASKEDLLRLVFDLPANINDFTQTPLSKLKFDILSELGVLDF